jgi:hypothetical protein
VLRGEKEIMMFVEQRAVESNQSLPLIIVEWIVLRASVVVNFDTLCLDHHKARIDSLDLGYQLLLRERPGLGLLEDLRVLLSRGGCRRPGLRLMRLGRRLRERA